MAERTPRTRAKRTPAPGYGEGREALLRATITVVARGGLRALTYRAVAEEAGVTHALVRFHFGSRDALIVAATEYSVPLSIEIGGLESGSEGFDDYGASLAGMVADEGDITAFQYEVILESRRRPELQPAVRGLYEEFWRAAAEDLRMRGLDADSDLAVLVFAAMDGLVFQELTIGDPKRLKGALRQLRALLRLAAEHPEALTPRTATGKTAGTRKAVSARRRKA